MAGVKVGVVGASGYAGAELLRLCAGHPDLEVVYATADANAGAPVAALYPSLKAAYGDTVFDAYDLDRLAGLLRMEQIATWSLRQRVVTIGNGTPGKWGNREKTIAFDLLHDATVTTAKPIAPGCTVVRLLLKAISPPRSSTPSP